MRPLTNSNEIKDRHCPLPDPVPSREPALFPPPTRGVAPTPLFTNLAPLPYSSRSACTLPGRMPSPRPDPAPYLIPRMNSPQSWPISSSSMSSISSITSSRPSSLSSSPVTRLKCNCRCTDGCNLSVRQRPRSCAPRITRCGPGRQESAPGTRPASVPHSPLLVSLSDSDTKHHYHISQDRAAK